MTRGPERGFRAADQGRTLTRAYAVSHAAPVTLDCHPDRQPGARGGARHEKGEAMSESQIRTITVARIIEDGWREVARAQRKATDEKRDHHSDAWFLHRHHVERIDTGGAADALWDVVRTFEPWSQLTPIVFNSYTGKPYRTTRQNYYRRLTEQLAGLIRERAIERVLSLVVEDDGDHYFVTGRVHDATDIYIDAVEDMADRSLADIIGQESNAYLLALRNQQVRGHELAARSERVELARVWSCVREALRESVDEMRGRPAA